MSILRSSLLPLALAACGEVHPVSTNPDAAPPTDGTDAPSCTVPASHPTIQAALDDASCTTIALTPGPYLENLTIARDVTLSGAAIIDGGGKSSVIAITSGTVSLEHLTLRNGRAPEGGGIANHGTLSLKDVRIDANTALSRGGGIFSDGPSLTLEVTTVSGNHLVPDSPVAAGGGIYVASGPLTITGGSIESNDIKVMAPLHDVKVSGAGIASDGEMLSISKAAVKANAITVDTTGMNLVAGGGVSSARGTATLSDVSIADNTIFAKADVAQASGAGVAASRIVATNTTITNNSVEAFSGGGSNATTKGGGVHVLGPGASSIIDSTIRDNKLTLTLSIEGGFALGAGIARDGKGDLEVTRTTLEANRATVVGVEVEAAGGGIWWAPDPSVNGGSVTISRSTVARNAVNGYFSDAGGIGASMQSAGHLLRIVDSTIDHNSVDGVENALGGGAYISTVHANGVNTLSISNSTLSGNTCKTSTPVSSTGGGLFSTNLVANGLIVQVSSSTIVANSATGSPAGTGGVQTQGSVRTQFRNTIVSNNNGARPDCSPSITSLGFSLFGSATGCQVNGTGSDKIGVSANVGPLADNSGPTRTHALLVGSPALDAADPLGCSDDITQLVHDQRGMPRIVNGRCDIGAFER